MISAGMIYEMSLKRDAWNGLAVSTWVTKITEAWNDEGWRELGVDNWEEDAQADDAEMATLCVGEGGWQHGAREARGVGRGRCV